MAYTNIPVLVYQCDSYSKFPNHTVILSIKTDKIGRAVHKCSNGLEGAKYLCDLKNILTLQIMQDKSADLYSVFLYTNSVRSNLMSALPGELLISTVSVA